MIRFGLRACVQNFQSGRIVVFQIAWNRLEAKEVGCSGFVVWVLGCGRFGIGFQPGIALGQAWGLPMGLGPV